MRASTGRGSRAEARCRKATMATESASDRTTTRVSLARVVTMRASTRPLPGESPLPLDHQGAEEQDQVDDRHGKKGSRPTRARRLAQAVAPPAEEDRAEQARPYEVRLALDAERHEKEADRDQR